MSTYASPAIAKQQPTMNSGDSDVSPDGSPSQFLLLRGLEPTVTEDLLAKGVSKLYKPSRQPSPPAASSSKKGSAKVASTTGDANLGAKEGSLRRVLLVRDRRSNESWRYGFAEFATVDVCLFTALLKYANGRRTLKLLSSVSTPLINLQYPPNQFSWTTCMPACLYPSSTLQKIPTGFASVHWATLRPNWLTGTKKRMSMY